MRLKLSSKSEEIDNVLNAKQESIKKDGDESVVIQKENKNQLCYEGRITRAFDVEYVIFSVEDATQRKRVSIDVIKTIPKGIKIIYNENNDNSVERIFGNDGDYNIIRRVSNSENGLRFFE